MMQGRFPLGVQARGRDTELPEIADVLIRRACAQEVSVEPVANVLFGYKRAVLKCGTGSKGR